MKRPMYDQRARTYENVVLLKTPMKDSISTLNYQTPYHKHTHTHSGHSPHTVIYMYIQRERYSQINIQIYLSLKDQRARNIARSLRALYYISRNDKSNNDTDNTSTTTTNNDDNNDNTNHNGNDNNNDNDNDNNT